MTFTPCAGDRRTIRFVTGNSLKFAEARALAPDILQFSHDVPEVQSLDVAEVVRAKVQLIRELDLPFPFFVEDTGLEISPLEGLPGALVKWFLSTVGPDGLARLALGRATAVPATAVSAVGAQVDGKIMVWTGRTAGSIVHPRGEGVGWNPIFQPAGTTRTFAEMSDDERLRASMRSKPILDAVRWLEEESGRL